MTMRCVFALILTCAAAGAQTKDIPWLQWGGPNRNFQTEAAAPVVSRDSVFEQYGLRRIW